MKIFYAFFTTVVLSLCSYAQANKVVNWPPVAPEQAYVDNDAGYNAVSDSKGLEIVEITVEGKKIVPGVAFSAEADWLRTFAVKVRNISNKKILSIRLHFSLPEAKYRDGISGFSLEYGKELSTGIDYGVQPLVEPGQEVVLVRNDRHYTRDRDGIAKRTGITEFNTVIIAVSTIRFEDGTVSTTYKLPIAIAAASKLDSAIAAASKLDRLRK